jgi:hypothetical protein
VKRIVGALLIASMPAFLVACGSSAPAQHGSASPRRSGAEVIAGVDTHKAGNPAPVVPVNFTGVFSASGTITLHRCSPLSHYRCIDKPAFNFADGSLAINSQQGARTQHVDAATCASSFASTETYTITGGSGGYAGATGHGVATIKFTAVFPRLHGNCDIAAKAVPVKSTARLHFQAHGPVTLKQAR